MTKCTLLFAMHVVREYTQFLDFAYPELDASSKPNYTAGEGYDRHLKIIVPFFVNVHTLLVEVLEMNASRFQTSIVQKFVLPKNASSKAK